MAVIFGDIWRKVRLHAPSAPVFLVQDWVQDAYRDLSDRRGWLWLTIENQLVWGDARTIAVVTTLGSTSVTSTAAFLATDIGRQFRVGTYPIYTIVDVSADLNTATLDRAYVTTGVGAVNGQIVDAYTTMPAEFGRFVALLDPINQRLVPWWATQEELDLIDPMRTSSSTPPRLLVARRPSTLTATLGQVQYEYWPIPTTAGALQYYAVKRPTPPADTDPLPGVLRDRPDVIETGALARAAAWPGTTDLKNPYFSVTLAEYLEAKFERLALQLDLRDDDQAQQSWGTIPWQRWNTWSWAFDTHLLQATDATLAAYAGMGGYGLY